MGTTTPLDVIRDSYALYGQGDFAAVLALLSPDIEIVQTADLPWGGKHRGHDGARRFFSLLGEYTAAMPSPERYIEAGDDVVAIGRLRGVAKATQQPIDLDIVHVWTVRNGLITRFMAYIDTPAMQRALMKESQS